MASIYHLREIARVVKTFGNKSSRLLFESPKILGRPSAAKQLAIKFGAPLPDEGKELDWERFWAQEILDCRENDRRYIVLRSKVKRLLLDRLFHLDIRTGSEYRRAVYQSAKELFWIRMLVMFGAQQVAMWLVPKALVRARTFELTDDRIRLLTLLRHDAVINGKRTNYGHIVQELTEATAIRNAEERMRAMNDALNVQLIGKAVPMESTVELARTFRREALRIFESFPTYTIGLDYFRLAALDATCSRDYRDLFRLCRQSRKYFAGFPHLVTPLTEGQFAARRFRASVAMHDFDAANGCIPDCERTFPGGSNNYFIWKRIEMLLRLHEQDFTKAAVLHAAIISDKRFPSQPEPVRQAWKYFGYYTDFALWHQDRSKPLPMKQFKKVLWDVPFFKHDKGGYDAALLILQYLLILFSEDENAKPKLIEKEGGFRRYIARYLRNQTHTQIYAFIKILLLLHKCDFDIARAEKRGKRYIVQFSSYGHEEVDEKQSFAFPMTWEWIVERLSQMQGVESA